MLESIERAIRRTQQNFEIAGGLNPVQIEIEDDRVFNMLKKHKNVIRKLTPLGILFPASIEKDTEQVLISSRELKNVKKPLINGKNYGLLGIIDPSKLITEKKRNKTVSNLF